MNGIDFEDEGDRIELEGRGRAMPPSPYTRLLASQVPWCRDQIVADVGTGSGVLAILSLFRGAAAAYGTDISAAALQEAAANARHNGVQDRFTPVLADPHLMFPLPPSVRFDLVICNPASLPMPHVDSPDSPFFAGIEGRAMIETLLREGSVRLNPKGRLLFTHTSLANFSATKCLMADLGLDSRIVAHVELPFRPFYNRRWLDALGGTERGLYHLRGPQAYETVMVVEAMKCTDQQPSMEEQTLTGRTA